jgi:hypothetical protein
VQISIHPKAKIFLNVVGAIVLIGIVSSSVHQLFHIPHPTTDAAASSDVQAAVNAATAFYTLDYTADPELWTTRVCELTTDAGCNAVRSFFSPAIQTMVRKYRIRTGCSVIAIRVVSDHGSVRVWQVSVAISHPWPELDNPVQAVFVEVQKVNGIWLMNRILFRQEVENLLTPTP